MLGVLYIHIPPFRFIPFLGHLLLQGGRISRFFFFGESSFLWSARCVSVSHWTSLCSFPFFSRVGWLTEKFSALQPHLREVFFSFCLPVSPTAAALVLGRLPSPLVDDESFTLFSADGAGFIQLFRPPPFVLKCGTRGPSLMGTSFFPKLLSTVQTNSYLAFWRGLVIFSS